MTPLRDDSTHVSIHAPLTGGDDIVAHAGNNLAVFQSTPPSREATQPVAGPYSVSSGFNPRPPHGRRPCTPY